MSEDKRSLFEDLMSPRTDNLSQCKVNTIMSAMDEKDREAFAKAVEMVKADKGQGRSRTYSASWLTSVLKKHGHIVSTSTVLRHVTGACSCE
jgi:hypothetical protein